MMRNNEIVAAVSTAYDKYAPAARAACLGFAESARRHRLLVFVGFVVLPLFLLWPVLVGPTLKNSGTAIVIDAQTGERVPDVLIASEWTSVNRHFQVVQSSSTTTKYGRRLYKSDANGVVIMKWAWLVGLLSDPFASQNSQQFYAYKKGYTQDRYKDEIERSPFDSIEGKRRLGLSRDDQPLVFMRKVIPTAGVAAPQTSSTQIKNLPRSDVEFLEHLPENLCEFKELREFYWGTLKPLYELYEEQALDSYLKRMQSTVGYPPSLKYAKQDLGFPYNKFTRIEKCA